MEEPLALPFLTEPDTGAARNFPQGRGFLRTPFNTAAATLLVWTVATVAAAQPNVSHAPVGWDAELRLSEISDRNADPGVVELTLTAKVASVDVGGGKRVTAWTYDGGFPAP